MSNAAHQAHDDGNLPAARRNLGNAISALIDPKPHNRQLDNGNNRIEWVDSLYDQLTDCIPGGQGNGRSTPQSSPPMCIDAVDLLKKIHHDLAELVPHPNIDGSTDNPAPIDVIRLRDLDKRTWRPQDCDLIGKTTDKIMGWCDQIRSLINPERKWTLSNPCPACGTAIVYRRSSAGELVRQPALQIGSHGCVCQHCRHVWNPEYFQHLAAVLGYGLPTGVIE